MPSYIGSKLENALSPVNHVGHKDSVGCRVSSEPGTAVMVNATDVTAFLPTQEKKTSGRVRESLCGLG